MHKSVRAQEHELGVRGQLSGIRGEIGNGERLHAHLVKRISRRNAIRGQGSGIREEIGYSGDGPPYLKRDNR